MALLAVIGLVLWLVSLVCLTLGTYLVFSHTRKRKRQTFQDAVPPISILKPLKGCDAGLQKNLLSFFELEYPKYELLFSIADPNDEAREIVEELIQTYPKTDARLIVGGSHIGENPKVNNIYVSYQTAKYDHILISDSNVRVKKSYLKQMIHEMKDGVSLVTACIAGRHADALGGYLEANYLNTFLNRWMHMSYLVDHPIVLGKSMLFKRSEFEGIGGLKAVCNQIAEDYAAARLMRQHDMEIVLLRDAVTQYLGKFSFQSFWARHVRWGRIRKSCSFFEFIIEPASCAFVAGLVGAWGYQYLYHGSFVGFFFSHSLFWLAQDLYLIKNRGEKLNLRAVGVWALYEALTLPIWVHTLMSSSIEWRGNRLRLGEGGRLLPSASLTDLREPHLSGSNLYTTDTREIPFKRTGSKKR